jgi:lipoprotein-anchoring transpeptidase ErfK/SrfK
MTETTRRIVVTGAFASLAASLSACVPASGPSGTAKPGTKPTAFAAIDPGFFSGDIYGPVTSEPFPVRAVASHEVDQQYRRTVVSDPTGKPAGTITIDPRSRYLYLSLGNGKAIRYGVGVGREGFLWAGTATIHDKQAWPDWYPPKEMFQRQPEIKKSMTTLQSGIGMKGGPGNPLGARAMYLWQGNKDTLFRIHGTLEPSTIGKNVSSGCIRMINQDVMDLYERVPVGTTVIVLPA